MKVVWTEPAVEDLRELHAYIARDSELYASGFVEQIILTAGRLRSHPRIGRVVPETNDEHIRELFISTIESSIASPTNLLKCCR